MTDNNDKQTMKDNDQTKQRSLMAMRDNTNGNKSSACSSKAFTDTVRRSRKRGSTLLLILFVGTECRHTFADRS